MGELRLKEYAEGEFERVHAAGSRILTASNVAALFGKSPWSGRFGLACHMTGRVPFLPISTALTQRGKDLEETSARLVAREKGWKVETVNGYAEHPSYHGRVLASPDMIAWRPDRRRPGVGEGKVVARPMFEQRWADGPPIYVELQHQLQLRNTGADWGFISALVVGDFMLDLIVYETKPNRPAIKIIDKAIGEFFKILDAGDMPEPDPHSDSLRALHTLYPKADPGLIVPLEDAESIRIYDAAVIARDTRLAADKVEKDAKAYFRAKAKGAGLVELPGGRKCVIKVVRRDRVVTEALSYRQLDFVHVKPMLPAPVSSARRKRVAK